jgi:SH3 domain protein
METSMKLKYLCFTYLPLVVIFAFLLFPVALQAKTLYVSDVLVISIRSGPGKSYKIIKTINSGAAMTLLEDQGEFVKVRTSENIEGWVAKFYTSSEIPKPLIISRLQTDLKRMEAEAEKFALQTESLTEGIVEISGQKSSNELKVKALTEELLGLKEKHDSILTQSNSIVKTTQERDQLKQELKRISQKLERIEKENDTLSDLKMIYWFLAGAGTFLLGWIMGKLSRKNQKRTLSI